MPDNIKDILPTRIRTDGTVQLPEWFRKGHQLDAGDVIYIKVIHTQKSNGQINTFEEQSNG